MFGLIDLSYALDVEPFVNNLQKFNLVFKLGINRLAPSEALTLVFTDAYIQSFRLITPG